MQDKLGTKENLNFTFMYIYFVVDKNRSIMAL